MRATIRFILFVAILLTATRGSAQIKAVGFTGGRFPYATDCLLCNLDGGNIVQGTVLDARLPVLMTGHTLTTALLGSNLNGGGFLGTSFAQGTATGQLLTAGRQVLAGTGLSGGGPLTGDVTFNLANTAVTASSYPAAGQIPTITVNAQGQIIAAGSSTDGSALTGVIANTATALILSGQTLWATPTVGEVGYMTTTSKTLAKAKADASATTTALCVYRGTAGSCAVGGAITCFVDAGLTLTGGDYLYLSDAAAGRFTNVAPSTAGHFVYKLAILVDTAGYNSGSGSAQSCVFNPDVIVQL